MNLGLGNQINDDSRKGAKDAKHKQDYKFKARNPKLETDSTDENPNQTYLKLSVEFGFRESDKQ